MIRYAVIDRDGIEVDTGEPITSWGHAAGAAGWLTRTTKELHTVLPVRL